MLDRGTKLERFSSWLAVQTTSGVGTMACAHVFASSPAWPGAILRGGCAPPERRSALFHQARAHLIVAWIAQTILLLVPCSIVIGGQNTVAEASDKRAEDTYKDAESILAEPLEIQSTSAGWTTR